jgi:hypothetical protein
MKSARRGRNTSAVEVTNVSPHGFWLLIDDRERFVSFEVFPWFRDATIADLTAVELPGPHHLYWPNLDIDLAVDSIDYPERYPLVGRRPGLPRVKDSRPASRQ